MQFAVIEAGKVTNIIMLETVAQAAEFPNMTLVEISKSGASIGYSYTNGKFKSNDPVIPAASLLKNAVATSIIEIDNVAEAARQRYITVTATQQQVYDFKTIEAESYIAASYPTTATKLKAFPLLVAQAAITGETIKVIADTIVTTKSLWLGVAGNIEGQRLNGKAAVKAAVNEAAAFAARDVAITALEAI